MPKKGITDDEGETPDAPDEASAGSESTNAGASVSDPAETPPPRPLIIDDVQVPRVPRPRFYAFKKTEMIRIAMLAALLVGVISLRKPCSEGVSSFVESFEAPIDAAPYTAPYIAPLPEGTELINLREDGGLERLKKILDELKDAGASE